jgi:hypothetical protein
MICSFAMMRAGCRRHAFPPNSSRAASFPTDQLSAAQFFGVFSLVREPVEATSVCYRGTAPEDKMQVSIRFSFSVTPETSR